MAEIIERLVAAALPHVAFDGWSEATFRAAVVDSGVDEAVARALAPRGAGDLAAAFHRAGDAAMVAAYAGQGEGLRYREKVALLIRLRLQGLDREVVRRGMAFYAQPLQAATGVALIWGTADAIWNALGDTSEDVNWYSKRLILSGVFSSTVMFWLGDKSEGQQATWDFVDRRIEDVMRFEGFKGKLRENQAWARLIDSPLNPLKLVRKPHARG